MLQILNLDIDDDPMLTQPSRGDMSLMQAQSKWTKARYVEYARYALFEHLRNRCLGLGSRSKPRADMQGVECDMDVFAAMALHNK